MKQSILYEFRLVAGICFVFGSWSLIYIFSKIYVGPDVYKFILINCLCLPILFVVPHFCFMLAGAAWAISVRVVIKNECIFINNNVVIVDEIVWSEKITNKRTKQQYMVLSKEKKKFLLQVEEIGLFFSYILIYCRHQRLFYVEFITLLFLVNMMWDLTLSYDDIPETLLVLNYDEEFYKILKRKK